MFPVARVSSESFRVGGVCKVPYQIMLPAGRVASASFRAGGACEVPT